MTPGPWLLRAANAAALLAGAWLAARGRAAEPLAPLLVGLALHLPQGALALAGRPAASAARRRAEDAACVLDLLFLVWTVHWIGAWRAGLETAALTPAALLALRRGPWAGAAAGALPVLAAAALGAAAGRPLGPYDALAALLGALPPAAAGLAAPAAAGEAWRAARRTLSRLRAAQFGEYLSFALFQLRDYLTTLASLSEALALGDPDEGKRQERVERLRRTVHELNAKLARLLGDRAPLTSYQTTRGTVDVAELARAAAEEARAAFAPTGVSLDLRVEGALPPARSDARVIELALLAVLQNALEACRRRGGGRVALRLRPAEGRVELEIDDDGGGIPPHALPTLFEPIVSAAPGGEGLGLGLSMTRRFLERIGGRVRVKSQGGLTAVLLEIPLDRELPLIRNEESTWAGRRAEAL